MAIGVLTLVVAEDNTVLGVAADKCCCSEFGLVKLLSGLVRKLRAGAIPSQLKLLVRFVNTLQ